MTGTIEVTQQDIDTFTEAFQGHQDEINVEVTQQDIDTFKEAYERHQYDINTGCPIALAIKRVFPNQEVIVGFHHIYINRIKHASTTPRILEEFAHMHFYPVKFNIVEADQ